MSEGAKIVAKAIMDRLLAEQLVDARDLARFLPRLADGELRPEDWRFAIEKSMPEVTNDERAS